MRSNKQFSDLACGDLAQIVQPLLRNIFNIGALVLVALLGYMSVTEHPAWLPFCLVAAGGLIPCLVWAHSKRPGLPLVTMLGTQTIAFYATPIFVRNPDVMAYGLPAITSVAFDVLLFGLALAGGWYHASHNLRYNSRPTYRRFGFIGGANEQRLITIAPILLGVSVAYLLLGLLGMLSFVPAGGASVLRAIADSAGVGGALLGAYFVSMGLLRGLYRTLYWILIVCHCTLTIYNYTLFPAAGLLMAMILGMFLGGGRVPVVPLVLTVLTLAFFNLSKFEMRRKYWAEGEAFAYQGIGDLPSRFSEWATLSWESLTIEDTRDPDTRRETQQLSKRVNNLSNLLDARLAMAEDGIKPYGGGSYTIIPLLFIPRLFWEDKPRTHEGMVQLNIHFGRQTREESLTTYISWGLLPEGYANFGSIWGPVVIGLALGFFAGYLERWARPYPFTSLEALIFLSIAVQFGTSFEMVASVWLTSMFQMVVALILGTMFFVTKVKPPPKEVAAPA